MAAFHPRHAFAVAVGLLVVVLLASYVGPGAIVGAFAQASPWFVLAAAFCYAAFFIVRGIRWRHLLRPVAPQCTTSTASSLTAAGWLVSTFVPMKAGDATRTAQLARRERANVVGVAGTVVVERGLDILGLSILLSGTMLTAVVIAHHELPPLVAQVAAVAWVLPLIGLAVLWFAARRWSARPEGGNIVVRLARRFVAAVESLTHRPREIPGLLLLTIVTSMLQAGIFFFLFLAFIPDAPLALVAAGAPLFLLSFIVALTPGNIGTYESAFVAVYALLGFEPTVLIPMGITIHVLTATIVLLLGGIGYSVHRLTLEGPREPRPTIAPEVDA